MSIVNNNYAINTGSKDANNPSSNDLDTNHKQELENAVLKNEELIKDNVKDIQKQVIAANKRGDDLMVRSDPEHINIYLTLSENVYQVARLICQMEYDLDWDSYVSELIKEDVFSIKNGDRGIFKGYVDRMLETEER